MRFPFSVIARSYSCSASFRQLPQLHPCLVTSLSKNSLSHWRPQGIMYLIVPGTSGYLLYPVAPQVHLNFYVLQLSILVICLHQQLYVASVATIRLLCMRKTNNKTKIHPGLFILSPSLPLCLTIDSANSRISVSAHCYFFFTW